VIHLHLNGILGLGTYSRSTRAQRMAVEFPLGADLSFDLTVLDSTGAPADLAGSVLTLTLKKRSWETPLLRIVGVLGTQRGTATFRAFATDTLRSLRPGRHVYDVWMTSGGGVLEPVVQISPAFCQPSVGP
jgi:hypothetical protein